MDDTPITARQDTIPVSNEVLQDADPGPRWTESIISIPAFCSFPGSIKLTPWKLKITKRGKLRCGECPHEHGLFDAVRAEAARIRNEVI